MQGAEGGRPSKAMRSGARERISTTVKSKGKKSWSGSKKGAERGRET